MESSGLHSRDSLHQALVGRVAQDSSSVARSQGGASQVLKDS